MFRKLTAYAAARRWLLLFFLLSSLIYLLIQYLSGQNLSFAAYAVGLNAAILILLLIPDARAFLRRRRALALLMTQPSELSELLPNPGDALEADYAQLCRALDKNISETRRVMSTAQSEQLQYYTLWVHQIKTPISAMRMVLQDNPDLPGRAVLEQEIFKVERYVEMALTYVKTGDLSTDLVVESVDLSSVVRQCVKKYAVLFVYKRLRAEIAEDLPTSVLTDEKWLAFILEQLISNAVKYTHQGFVRIYMESGELVVEDSGIGIRPEDLERIFEKGYTGYNGRLDKKASGIGLYLTKKVASALSIGISVTSQVNQGTRIALRFPNSDDWIYRAS